MTPIVLDASVALAWCFADEASAYAEAVLAALAEREALEPAVWPLEIVNALAVAERQKRIRPPDASRYLALLGGLAIRQVDTPHLTRIAPDGRSAPWLRFPAGGARSAQGASELPPEALTVAESVNNVLPLARTYRLSAYDATYLDASIRHEAPLATLDGGLADAGRKAGVAILPGQGK